MFNINSWQNSLGTVAGNTLSQSLTFIPNLIGALLVFVLGIILGNWSRTLIIKGLQFVKFDSLVKDSKIKEFLKKAEINQKVEEIFGTLIKWIIVLIFFIISATDIFAYYIGKNYGKTPLWSEISPNSS